jgi:hypothetical protein
MNFSTRSTTKPPPSQFNQLDPNNITASSYKNDPSQNFIIEFYTYPIIFLIGTFCNIMTFCVMRRKKMRHQSTYFYMAVLALTDEMVLIFGCLNFWIYLFFGSNLALLSNMSCKLVCLLFYATLHFSVWMVVVMTVERYIAVALPLQVYRNICSHTGAQQQIQISRSAHNKFIRLIFSFVYDLPFFLLNKAMHLCTVKRAKTATCLLASVILAINAHFLFTHYLNESFNCKTTSDTTEFFMLKVWPWIDASVYSFVPLLLLILFNMLIIGSLVRASKNIDKLTNR